MAQQNLQKVSWLHGRKVPRLLRHALVACTTGSHRLNGISYANLQAIDTDAKIFRTHSTRSSGEQMMYGVYSKLPLEHAIAFLMGTHKLLGNQVFIKGCSSKKTNLYLALIRYDSSLLQMILQETSCNSMIYKTYAKFPALRKIMGDASV